MKTYCLKSERYYRNSGGIKNRVRNENNLKRIAFKSIIVYGGKIYHFSGTGIVPKFIQGLHHEKLYIIVVQRIIWNEEDYRKNTDENGSDSLYWQPLGKK